MHRFDDPDEFQTFFDETIASARRSRRLRRQALAREFCSLAALAAFIMVGAVWAGILAPASDPETIVLVSEVGR